MTVRFFHTSDWHLGQYFYQHNRHYEHAQFLSWLLDQIEEKQPDALLIAGDIFDVINPSSQAQKQLYQFLADAQRRAPHLQTLMIAGNHDSGYRIEQVDPLLEKYQTHAVGVLQRSHDQQLDLERLILPIYNAENEVVAWCLALPFLRSAEITSSQEHSRTSQDAITYIHQQIIERAKSKKTKDQALILMSHAHMQGGETSDSERPIIIGNEEALSITLFDQIIDYVALGHLHKPQQVQHPHIRYSGSPIPLSFSEVNYKHQVVEVCIEANAPIQIKSLMIPRCVELYKITGELNEVFDQLRALPTGEIESLEQRPYIDIEYHTLTPPAPQLRQQLEDALPRDRYRLVRIARTYHQNENDLSQPSNINLSPPTPHSLFQQLWQQQGYDHDTEVEKDFASLVQEAETLLEQQTEQGSR
jgi:exonuclease SbcD